jgi:tRNA(fMet)-specific endonuclease VapC
MILLDTDTVPLFHQGHPQVVVRVQAANAVAPVGTTVITQAEILRARFDYLLKANDGHHLQQAQYWLEESEALLAALQIVPIDATAADEFDRLRGQKKLKKIGRADLLIASIALAQRATLVSRNLRHFRQVPGLTVENWAT